MANLHVTTASALILQRGVISQQTVMTKVMKTPVIWFIYLKICKYDSFIFIF